MEVINPDESAEDVVVDDDGYDSYEENESVLLEAGTSTGVTEVETEEV